MQTVHDNVQMAADLATDGQYDPHALDAIIKIFEEAHPDQVQDLDEVLWVGFFRKHASFITRCHECRAKFAAAEVREAAVRGVEVGMRVCGPGGGNRRMSGSCYACTCVHRVYHDHHRMSTRLFPGRQGRWVRREEGPEDP